MGDISSCIIPHVLRTDKTNPNRAVARAKNTAMPPEISHARDQNEPGAAGSGGIEVLAQLALLLQDLELEALDAVLQGLAALLQDARAQPRTTVQTRRVATLGGPGLALLLLLPRGRGGGGVVEAALLQLGAGLEGLDAAVDAGDVRVRAREERRYGRRQLGAQGRLGRLERGLRDQLVVARGLQHAH